MKGGATVYFDVVPDVPAARWIVLCCVHWLIAADAAAGMPVAALFPARPTEPASSWATFCLGSSLLDSIACGSSSLPPPWAASSSCSSKCTKPAPDASFSPVATPTSPGVSSKPWLPTNRPCTWRHRDAHDRLQPSRPSLHQLHVHANPLPQQPHRPQAGAGAPSAAMQVSRPSGLQSNGGRALTLSAAMRSTRRASSRNWGM